MADANKQEQAYSPDPEWTNIFRPEVAQRETLDTTLSRIPVFNLLSGKELALLGRIVHVRHYYPGESVIKRGVQQSGFYLIRSGSVHIMRQDINQAAKVVATLGLHELLGEFSLLDGTPRTSSIVTAEASELIGFFKPDLMDILVTNPQLGCKILLRLAEEMSRSLQKDYRKLRDTKIPLEDLQVAVRVEPVLS
jgi:CRP/FNR family cyclic AMP-dependent transcriptional regulator